MRAVSDHFAHHKSHLVGCGLAGSVIVVAIVFGLPVLAIFGALMCGVMMLGMAWMMVSMARNGHH